MARAGTVALVDWVGAGQGELARDGGSGMLAGSTYVDRMVGSTTSRLTCTEGGAEIVRRRGRSGGTGDERVDGVTEDSVIDEIVDVSSVLLPSAGGLWFTGEWSGGEGCSRDTERVLLCDRKGGILTSKGLSESESSNAAGRRGK